MIYYTLTDISGAGINVFNNGNFIEFFDMFLESENMDTAFQTVLDAVEKYLIDPSNDCHPHIRAVIETRFYSVRPLDFLCRSPTLGKFEKYGGGGANYAFTDMKIPHYVGSRCGSLFARMEKKDDHGMCRELL